MTTISGAGYSLIDILAGQTGAEQEDNSVMATAKKNLAKNTASTAKKNVYKTSWQAGHAALQRAIGEMQKTTSGPINGSKIKEYQQELESIFSSVVRVEATLLGVPLETEFKISMSKDSMISVECADPVSKKIIEDFLAENPKVCEEFGYIQALANFDRAKQMDPRAHAYGLTDLQAELQLQVIDAFFGESTDSFVGYAPMTASFSGQQDTPASFFAGLNVKV